MYRSVIFLVALFSLSPLATFAATPSDPDKEYDQVRMIALRDPKVRAGFEKANERLEAKIIEIDPALKGYVKGRTTMNTASPNIRKSVAASAAETPRARTHIIATGDTLSTIAARYQTTVGALKTANPRVDEKKLQVGDSLTIAASPRRGSKP